MTATPAPSTPDGGFSKRQALRTCPPLMPLARISRISKRLARLAAGLALPAIVLLAGCATAQRPDPLESLNRGTFAVNEAVDKAVLKPVARTYTKVVPSPVRTGVANIFSNVGDVGSAVNLFLQGRPRDGVSDVMRVGTNTVFGVLGIFDVASALGMKRHGEDFGQTLGHWGAGPGAYIVLPLLGPSTVRDALARPVDSLFSPLHQIDSAGLSNKLTVVQLTSGRAQLLPATDLIDQVALDKYLFVREAYLQRRQSLIRVSDEAGGPATEPLATP